MATLLLSAVGTAIGGPIGGALGAIVGQQVDQNILFRPKGRQGPRLQELAVQTSSYGAQIPRIFGMMRVAGTVIWATDLKEVRSREGGGKGRPSTTVYSYSACFAVALSSRRIKSIGRIWADGKIFRGLAGDFKTETRFSLHKGGEDQPVDGLMASAEASGGTPAYRGLALAVFEDMDLTQYGNRIPSLTFEVIADDGSVTLTDIVGDISGQRIAMPTGDGLIGYAAGGEDRRAALLALTDVIPLSLSSDPGAIDRIQSVARSAADASSAAAFDANFVRTAGTRTIAPPARRTASIAAAPRQFSVRYYDPARDYQSGAQSAFRPGAGRVSTVIDFPATIVADQARKIAATSLWSQYDERSTLDVAVPLDGRLNRPGKLVKFNGWDGLWRVRECEIGRGLVQLSLTRASADRGLAAAGSEQGRSIGDPDLRAGLTRLILVDLPFALDASMTVSDSAMPYAAAAGDAGWRNAQLFASGPDGTAGAYIGQIKAPTTIGTISGALASANPALVDRVNVIDVVLHNANMTLAYADGMQLLAGRNLALVGQEIVQFAEAAPLGDGRFRLSRLIRGLGGTEAEVERHGIGEDFVLLDGASMLEIGAAHYAPFSPLFILALGRDDDVPVAATIASPGRALTPWSPVHPKWEFLGNGDLQIQWIRRSRAGTIWPDHVDVPLAEESEGYRVELAAESGSGPVIVIETSEPRVTVDVDQMETEFAPNINEVVAKIHQIGSHGLSGPLAFTIAI
ncbi:phage tail protein [Parasphingorhabdus sp.]|uniref:phage tail protein n=1 Tax=Parasphingorhabdus sp. TaxID=2709688 RepID=UPI003A8F7D73